MSTGVIIGILTGGVVPGLSIGACITLFYFRKKLKLGEHKKRASVNELRSSYSDERPRSNSVSASTLTAVRIHYQELRSDMTN